jgi:hypothetical protein
MTCKKQVSEMNECLTRYYKDEQFRKECEDIYLNKRSEYRRTGQTDGSIFAKKPYYESALKKEVMEALKTKREQEKLNNNNNNNNQNENSTK